MKYLLIVGHPSLTSLSRHISSTIARKLEDAGNEADIVDLYAKEYYLPYLSYQKREEMKDPGELVRTLQQKVTMADHIIMVHPIWWSAPPAIVKNFFDTVFAARFAYRYNEKGPVGLLGGRTVSIVATCGGPSWFYTFFLSPFKAIYKYAVIEFCGMAMGQVHVLGDVDRLPPDTQTINTFIDQCLKSITEKNPKATLLQGSSPYMAPSTSIK